MENENPKQVTLVLGGVRSGKSSFAQKLAMKSSSVGYIATAEAADTEMQAKIKRHRQERPITWRTIEEPLNIDEALLQNDHLDVLILDCLTIYAANLLATGEDAAAQESRMCGLYRALSASRASVILVSNEVGSGVVPPYPLGRIYRDLLGELNQGVAAIANNVVLMVAGLPLILKGQLDSGMQSFGAMPAEKGQA